MEIISKIYLSLLAKIAHGLALWEKNKFGNSEVNIEEVLFLSINHDIVEGYTGDILSTTKTLSPILKEELDRVEGLIFETHIVNTLPNSWGEMYIDLHKKLSSLSCVNSKIVKASDLLDRVFECIEEMNLSNIEPYKSILKSDLERLYNLDLMSVDYFLKYSIKDIDAYKYIPDWIKSELEDRDFSKYF